MNKFYDITEKTINGVIDLIYNDKMSIVDGGILEEFEEKAATLFGHKYGIGTCNGTASIHLAYFAIGIKPHDEVIMPTYGFHAMASPLIQFGGLPVFCDINQNTLTISSEDIEKKITPKTKALMIFQSWGNVANIDEILEIAKNHDLYLISDSSHAPSAKWRNKPLGEYFDIICASFGKGKLISGGELGVLTTSNTNFRDKALLYSHTNRVPKSFLTKQFKHISNIVGIKYRPHPLALKLAIDQIDSFKERNSMLVENVEFFIKEITKNGLFKVQESFTYSKRNYWKLILMSDEETVKNILEFAKIKDIKIEKNHYRTLMHEDSIFTEYYKIYQSGFPKAESLKSRIFQIDAIRFHDKDVLSKYLILFKQFMG